MRSQHQYNLSATSIQQMYENTYRSLPLHACAAALHPTPTLHTISTNRVVLVMLLAVQFVTDGTNVHGGKPFISFSE